MFYMSLDKHEQRRAHSAQLLAEDRRRDRRIRIAIGAACGLGVTGLLVGLLALSSSIQNEKQSRAIEGVKTWGDLSRDHTIKPVEYPMHPPVGGEHNPVWLKCEGTVYTKEVREENAVHSLEHGAVWVTYTNQASKADIEVLENKVSSTGYTMMSPYKDQESPITLTAWGHQLQVDRADDPRVNKFFDEYVQGPQTPEPYASCAGGYMQKGVN